MISINNDASGHACFTVVDYVGGGGCSKPTRQEKFYWRLFGDNEQMVRDALSLLLNSGLAKTRCNACFSRMGTGSWWGQTGGRPFDDVITDPEIWISYHYKRGDGFLGATSKDRPKEITITQDAFDRGHRFVAGTILHELAHVNGAPGGTSTMAEESLKECGLSDQFNPNVVGVNAAPAYDQMFRRV